MTAKEDFIQWQWTQTANTIISIINKRTHRGKPYWIMLQTEKGYNGPPSASHKAGRPTKTLNLKGKKLIHQKISIWPMDPGPRLGALVWKVDNRVGLVELVRSLPPDKPFAIEDSDNTGPIVEAVAKEAMKIKPAIIWN